MGGKSEKLSEFIRVICGLKKPHRLPEPARSLQPAATRFPERATPFPNANWSFPFTPVPIRSTARLLP